MAGLGLILFTIALMVWMGFQSFQGKANLERARTDAQQAKEALLSGKAADAALWAQNAERHSQQARQSTYSLPWNIVSAVPLLGSPFKTAQQISDVVAGLASDVLVPATQLGSALSPDTLLDKGRFNLALLRQEEPRLTELAAAASRLDAQAQRIAEPAYLTAIGDARSQLQDQAAMLAGLLGNTALAARLAPSMMGADGPRTYLMGFQTNAEARGTGGLLGGFGILRLDNGVPTVDNLGPNTQLADASAAVDLGREFNEVYGWTNPLTDFRNSNLSPHFPFAAQIWKSMWERQAGAPIDGVIAIDPVALSYVLGAIGSVMLADGEVITQENVVELTESTAYIRFPTDQAARKKYLQDIANAVVTKMTGHIQSPRKLLDALGRAASERRIAAWVASPDDQTLLETTQLAHAVPDDSAPYAAVIINNLAGNKMDYYLHREIEYVADGCDGDTRDSTITARLANTSTGKPLPDYVGGSAGLSADVPLKVPNGTMITAVRIIATDGARLMSVTSNGKRVAAITSRDRGHPSFEVQVVIPPGQSGELVFRLTEPTAPGAPRVPVQPLIDNVIPNIMVPTCPG